MNTLFALVMVVGTLLAILALVAFFVVRSRPWPGMSTLVLLMLASVRRWPGELAPSLLLGFGILASGWGLGRAVTVDVALRKLPGFAIRRGAGQPGRGEVLASALGFLLVGAAYLYFSARRMAGWMFVVLGLEFVAAAFLYLAGGAETPR